MTADTISVIIPAFNCEDTIERCVLAILEGERLPDEILLIDDCSTDGTPGRIQALVEQPGDLVVTVRTERNLGPAGARNVGVRAAKGKHLIFVDSDTQVYPDTVAVLARQLGNHDAVVGVYSDDPLNDIPSAHYKAMLYAAMLGRGGVQPYDQFSASCAGIRRAVFDAVGGYDEWFGAGLDFENEELGHRVASGYDMVLDPAVRTRHVFPGHAKMARTFFARTALWVEMFWVRRKFSTKAGTSVTGISSLALLGAVATLPLGVVHPAALALPLFAFAVYLAGYGGFFAYVLERRPRFLPVAVALNVYYTLLIALGAVWGLLKVISGRSAIAYRFRPKARTP